MPGVIESRLPPRNSALWQFYHFTPGSLFYIGSNECYTTPISAMQNGNNFLKVECHKAMLDRVGEGKKDKCKRTLLIGTFAANFNLIVMVEESAADKNKELLARSLIAEREQLYVKYGSSNFYALMDKITEDDKRRWDEIEGELAKNVIFD